MRPQKRARDAEPAGPSPIFFPRAAPFPSALTDDFPAMPYASRRGQVKSAAHWGQRKLLLSEVQLLVEALESTGRHTKFRIVYAGAAPGEHLRFLDGAFPGHHWELIDPMKFHPSLAALPNFSLRNEFFTNHSAYAMAADRLQEAKCPALGAVFRTHYEKSQDDCLPHRASVGGESLVHGVAAAAQPPLPPPPAGVLALCHAAMRRVLMLFVCDIRSGSVTQRGDSEEDEPSAAVCVPSVVSPFEAFERHVADDMTAQQTWVEILQPTFSMLKFRLPYMEVVHPITKEVLYRHPSETTSYLRGKVLLPVWARPTTTECRLLVPQGAFRVLYSNKRHEDQCFFFNAVLRENVHFHHVLDRAAPRSSFLDHRFDGAAEVHLLQRVLALSTPKARDSGSMYDEARAIIALSESISLSLNKTFQQADERLKVVRMAKARQRGYEGAERKLQQRIAAHRADAIWWSNDRPASTEREALGDDDNPFLFARTVVD